MPKIYHIVHVDRLRPIIAEGKLNCDAAMAQRRQVGTTIGMGRIKERRQALQLSSHPGLTVGSCVPFYFCPRSVMLYMLHRGNDPSLEYTGGQEPIVHLEFDVQAVADWADANGKRWAFTLSNAGAFYFEDRSRLECLNEINWIAVHAIRWAAPEMKEGKQAEFLVERWVPWALVERIGVLSRTTMQAAADALVVAPHRPGVEIKPDWYY